MELGTPLKPSTLTLLPEEIEWFDSLIAQGLLPPDWIERCDDARDANVFGVDAPKDKRGFRLEQGLGSTRNMTQQSIDAYKKWGKDESDYERNLARMEKLFAEQAPQREQRRAAQREERRQEARARRWIELYSVPMPSAARYPESSGRRA
jgi:hypothetical protein